MSSHGFKKRIRYIQDGEDAREDELPPEFSSSPGLPNIVRPPGDPEPWIKAGYHPAYEVSDPRWQAISHAKGKGSATRSGFVDASSDDPTVIDRNPWIDPPSYQHEPFLGKSSNVGTTTSPDQKDETKASTASLKGQETVSNLEEATTMRYKEHFGSIFGVSESEETKGKSLLEAAMWKCEADRERGNFTIVYSLPRGFPWCLKNLYPAGQLLGDILTLTGGTIDAYASSCRDYLSVMFPDIGPCILESLEQMLTGYDTHGQSGFASTTTETSGMIQVEFIGLKHYPMRPYSDKRTLNLYGLGSNCVLTGTYKTHVQAALVLSWLCASIPRFETFGISTSAVSIAGEIQSPGKRCISIGLEVLRTMLNVEPGRTCWHALFPHGIIAKNFPIPSRKFGVGLEIPFTDMALVCGSLGFVPYKNGLVVDGINSVLIPRARFPGDGGVQWHFESKTRHGERIAYTSDLLDLLDMDPCQNGTDSVSPDDLLSKRCFLAWAEKSTIMVGTESYFLTTTIGESHAKNSASMKCVHHYGLNLSGNTSLLNFGVTINLTPTAMPAFFNSSISNGISDILRAESTSNSNHFVLVYDTGAKIGWYLPQACVVLHMAHHYLAQQKLDLFDVKNQATVLKYVGEDGDTSAGIAAAWILYKALSLKTRRRTISKPRDSTHKIVPNTDFPSTSTWNDNDIVQFKDVVERLWYLLDTIGSTLKMNRSEYLKSSESVPHGVHGVDFNEILEPKSSEKVTSIRYVKLDQPWSYLTNDQATVLFCKNLGHTIVPSLGELCNSWSRVPWNKEILAITGTAIRYFLRKNESGLSNELRWILKQPLIQRHHGTKSPAVVHTQLLKSKDSDVLAKLKGKVGLAGQEVTLSNYQLSDAIDPECCLLFTDEPGKPCIHPAMYICEKGSSSPAEPSSAAISISPQIQLPIKLQNLRIQNDQDQLNEKLPSNGSTTITLSAIMDQPEANVSEKSSRKWKGKQPMINQDAGYQASHEHVSGVSSNVDTTRRAVENGILDEGLEQECSGSEASRSLLARKVGEPV